MNLRVGLIGSSLGWEELLRQEGVPFGAVTPGETDPSGFSVLAVCRPPRADEALFLREFLRDGGAFVGYAGYLSGIADAADQPVRLRYLIPGEQPILKGLSLMDVEFMGLFPREANCLRSEENVFGVFIGEVQGGWGVVTPFDPGTAMEDFRAAERYFYARPERLPSERVSRTAKGEVLHFVHAALRHLHHIRGLPYAHLSYTPPGVRNVFAFRIDTDAGTKEEINSCAALAGEFGFGFTWFLDVKSHGGWLRRFAELPGHEVGLHCFQHRIFLDASKDADNLLWGINVMKGAGITARSFAAPFGFWSPEYGRTIDAAQFEYSSEFSWAYDAFPHRPVIDGCRFDTLQVPVHPVSIGSLRRAGFTAAGMKSYLADVSERKLRRGEPLFFYHHPGHREWGVVRSILEFARGRDVRPLTLGQYAEWWKRRAGAVPQFLLTGTSIETRSIGGSSPEDVGVTISRSAGESAELKFGSAALLDDLPWRREEEYKAPSDMKRSREFDLRGSIGRQFNRLQRRFL